MVFIIHCTNLSDTAEAADVRRFFAPLDIPVGGVHILGGSDGDVYVAFATLAQAQAASLRHGEMLCGQRLTVAMSSERALDEHMRRMQEEINADEDDESPPGGQTMTPTNGAHYGRGQPSMTEPTATETMIMMQKVYPAPLSSASSTTPQYHANKSQLPPAQMTTLSNTGGMRLLPDLSRPPPSQPMNFSMPPPQTASMIKHQMQTSASTRSDEYTDTYVSSSLPRFAPSQAANTHPQAAPEFPFSQPRAQYAPGIAAEHQIGQSTASTHSHKRSLIDNGGSEWPTPPHSTTVGESSKRMRINTDNAMSAVEFKPYTQHHEINMSPLTRDMKPVPSSMEMATISAVTTDGSDAGGGNALQRLLKQLPLSMTRAQAAGFQQAPAINPTTEPLASHVRVEPRRQHSPVVEMPLPPSQSQMYYSHEPVKSYNYEYPNVEPSANVRNATSPFDTAHIDRKAGLMCAPAMAPREPSFYYERVAVVEQQDPMIPDADEPEDDGFLPAGYSALPPAFYDTQAMAIAPAATPSILDRHIDLRDVKAPAAPPLHIDMHVSMLQRYRYFKLQNMPQKLCKFHSLETFVAPIVVPNRQSVIFFRSDPGGANPTTDTCVVRIENNEDSCAAMLKLNGKWGLFISETTRLEYEQAAAKYDPEALSKDNEPPSIPCDQRVSRALEKKGEDFQQYLGRNYLMFDNIPYRATGAHITSFLARAGIAQPRSFRMIPNKDDKRYSGTWLVECASRAAYEATLLHGQLQHKLMDRIVYIRQLPCDPVWPPSSSRGGDHDMRNERRRGGRDRSRGRRVVRKRERFVHTPGTGSYLPARVFSDDMFRDRSLSPVRQQSSNNQSFERSPLRGDPTTIADAPASAAMSIVGKDRDDRTSRRRQRHGYNDRSRIPASAEYL